jgi:hypothetical protein
LSKKEVFPEPPPTPSPGSSMPSVYLPVEALQGEDVPSFALWEKNLFQRIEVEFPSALDLQEIYNVSKNDYAIRDRLLSVSKVEVDGYLGMLLKSSRIDITRKAVEVLFRFYRSDGTFHLSKATIELYRPLLATQNPPDTMIVKRDNLQPSSLIPISKRGDGTVLVWVRHTDESETKIEEAEQITALRNGLLEVLTPGFAKLKGQFREYKGILSDVETLFRAEPNFSDEEWVERVQAMTHSLREIALSDRKFAKSFVEIVAEAFIRNLHLLNPFEQLREYLQSIEGRQILLQNALDLVKFKAGNNHLGIRIEYTDLTLGYFPAVTIETKIHAEEAGEIPVYKLFEWT